MYIELYSGEEWGIVGDSGEEWRIVGDSGGDRGKLENNSLFTYKL